VYNEFVHELPLVGYVRASRWGRGSPRDNLAAQRAELERAAAAAPFALAAVHEDTAAGRSTDRPGLRAALEACRRGEAGGIVVTSLDRLTRSLDDLADLVVEARDGGFTIVALENGLDLRRPDGRLVADVLGEARVWGRRTLVRERAREVLGRRDGRRARGRPPSTPPELAERIRELRRGGATLQSICDTLNAEGVPTPRGGALWRPTSLRAVLRPLQEGEPR
jgi:DNA invertase Pin-like site-specific DNA recombinase